ncbi:unnamed protein product [Notodromas monacha]|uniref:Tetratricopeptide repeat protein 14 n=1 Tax=Notodromas monacha TaxID=399045 RepID=A0A7R9BFA2_9CRUS|nr:unnamed protein product [Notodromas monacha]CAG0913040.1 unnamed protein product [Notodromas monacha]
MSLLEKFFAKVGGVKLPDAPTTSLPSSRRNDSPDIIEISEPVPKSFTPKSVTLTKLERKLPPRYFNKAEDAAFKFREQTLRSSAEERNPVLPKKIMGLRKTNRFTKRKIGPKLTLTPSIGLYFPETRLASFMKNAACGQDVLVVTEKSTLRYLCGNLEVHVVGWYWDSTPVPMWDHEIRGSISRNQWPSTKDYKFPEPGDYLMCSVSSLSRLRSLKFVDLTLKNQGGTKYGRISPKSLSYMQSELQMEWKNVKIPKYHTVLKTSQTLEDPETLELLSRSIDVPKFACSFLQGVKPLDMKDFNQKQNSATANVFYSHGCALMKARRLPEALSTLENAVKHNPKNADFYVARSVIHQESEQYTKALEDLYKAIELNPDHETAYNFLGVLYVTLGKRFAMEGNTTDALLILEKCMKYDPGNEEAKRMLSDLRSSRKLHGRSSNDRIESVIGMMKFSVPDREDELEILHQRRRLPPPPPRISYPPPVFPSFHLPGYPPLPMFLPPPPVADVEWERKTNDFLAAAKSRSSRRSRSPVVRVDRKRSRSRSHEHSRQTRRRRSLSRSRDRIHRRRSRSRSRDRPSVHDRVGSRDRRGDLRDVLRDRRQETDKSPKDDSKRAKSREISKGANESGGQQSGELFSRRSPDAAKKQSEERGVSLVIRREFGDKSNRAIQEVVSAEVPRVERPEKVLEPVYYPEMRKNKSDSRSAPARRFIERPEEIEVLDERNVPATKDRPEEIQVIDVEPLSVVRRKNLCLETDQELKKMWEHWIRVCNDRRKTFGTKFLLWFKDCVRFDKDYENMGAKFAFPFFCVGAVEYFVQLYEDHSLDWLIERDFVKRYYKTRENPDLKAYVKDIYLKVIMALRIGDGVTSVLSSRRDSNESKRTIESSSGTSKNPEELKRRIEDLKKSIESSSQKHLGPSAAKSLDEAKRKVQSLIKSMHSSPQLKAAENQEDLKRRMNALQQTINSLSAKRPEPSKSNSSKNAEETKQKSAPGGSPWQKNRDDLKRKGDDERKSVDSSKQRAEDAGKAVKKPRVEVSKKAGLIPLPKEKSPEVVDLCDAMSPVSEETVSEIPKPPKRIQLDGSVVPGEEVFELDGGVFSRDDLLWPPQDVPVRPPLSQDLMNACATYGNYMKSYCVPLNDFTKYKLLRSPWVDEKWFGGPSAKGAEELLIEAIKAAEKTKKEEEVKQAPKVEKAIKRTTLSANAIVKKQPVSYINKSAEETEKGKPTPKKLSPLPVDPKLKSLLEQIKTVSATLGGLVKNKQIQKNSSTENSSETQEKQPKETKESKEAEPEAVKTTAEKPDEDEVMLLETSFSSEPDFCVVDEAHPDQENDSLEEPLEKADEEEPAKKPEEETSSAEIDFCVIDEAKPDEEEKNKAEELSKKSDDNQTVASGEMDFCVIDEAKPDQEEEKTENSAENQPIQGKKVAEEPAKKQEEASVTAEIDFSVIDEAPNSVEAVREDPVEDCSEVVESIGNEPEHSDSMSPVKSIASGEILSGDGLSPAVPKNDAEPSDVNLSSVDAETGANNPPVSTTAPVNIASVTPNILTCESGVSEEISCEKLSEIEGEKQGTGFVGGSEEKVAEMMEKMLIGTQDEDMPEPVNPSVPVEEAKETP